MATFQSPFGNVTIEVAEGNEAAYVRAGWPLVGAGANTEQGEKHLSQQNKSELVATANALGIDADESLTKKDLVELIEAAQAEAE